MKDKINLLIRSITGWLVIIIGIIVLPTPIPGLLIIVLGLVILEEKVILGKIKKLLKKWKKK